MSRPEIILGGLRVSTPPSWRDISDELEGADMPFTLADPETGSGALQFSPALHQSGPTPNPSPHELLLMVRQFGQGRNLGASFDEDGFASNSLRGAAASFHAGEDFIRAWYISDGHNLALVTYVCEWGSQTRELPACEEMIRSIQFSPARKD